MARYVEPKALFDAVTDCAVRIALEGGSLSEITLGRENFYKMKNYLNNTAVPFHTRVVNEGLYITVPGGRVRLVASE